jgi:diketogulonate reductase-like aldo/keto reductase
MEDHGKILNGGMSMAIGVSNYSIGELEKTIQTSYIVPAVNQIEFHPFLYQEPLLQFCQKKQDPGGGIWSIDKRKKAESPNH